MRPIVVDSTTNLSDWTVALLKSECSRLNLLKKGSKKELVGRLTGYYSTKINL